MSLNTLIGFDFGMRHIGVAIGQTVNLTAQPHTSIGAKDGVPHWEKIDSLVSTWRPDALVVGVPVHLDGTEHQITQASRAFISALLERFPLPVYPAEERLTSVEARWRLFANGGLRALSKQAIDGLAACLILEGWLCNYTLQTNNN